MEFTSWNDVYMKQAFPAKNRHALLERDDFDDYIPIPRKVKPVPKENYRVLIPRSVKELGIKNRNYTSQDLEVFIVDINRSLSDGRTSLMIKNIPNKYSQQMLRECIEFTHRGQYDFLYLPIDFQNKCNVGYAFINLRSVHSVGSFCHSFNGKRWEFFNSEKVCEISYARLQGYKMLCRHF